MHRSKTAQYLNINDEPGCLFGTILLVTSHNDRCASMSSFFILDQHINRKARSKGNAG
jgi:hypothetical protein